VAVGQQRRRHYAADVAGSTGDEYAHGGHCRRPLGRGDIPW
jgi:surface antigen